MYDVVALGELLIDFTPAGLSGNGNVLFERNPGGAPANELSILSKLGRKTGFIGKVGNDRFGKFLKNVLDAAGIETSGLLMTHEAGTTLAFVHLDSSGDRSFSFYRNPGADMLLREDELETDMLANTRIFHFGTLSMTHQAPRSATIKAVELARGKGALISFDPNLRPPLWDDLATAKEMMLEGLRYANILKVSQEELLFLTENEDMSAGTLQIQEKYNCSMILVTLGAEGCFFRRGEATGVIPAFKVPAIDTTGAGDAFLGAFLYKVLESGKTIEKLEVCEIEQMIQFANAAGALATTKKGAIPAMPGLKDIKSLMLNI